MDKSKKRITIILSIVIVLIILIAAGITTIILFNKNRITKMDPKTGLSKLVAELGIQDKNFEYGTTFNKADLKIPNDVKVLIDGEEITSEYTFKNLGRIPITLEKLNSNGQKETEIINVNIIDTKQPEIIGAEDRRIKQGEIIDLKENIKVEDNTDELIDVSVVGKVDTNIPGEYEITYIAIDQSNNSSEKKIKIKVEADPNAVANNNDNNNKANDNKNNAQKVVNTQPNNNNAKPEQKVTEQPKQEPQTQPVQQSQPTQPKPQPVPQPTPTPTPKPQPTPQPVPTPKPQPTPQPAPTPKPVNKPIVITAEAFEREVIKSNQKVLVDVYTDWCGYCKILAPTIDEIASENPNIKVVKVNVTKDKTNFRQKKGINGYPTLLLFQNGKEIRRTAGALSKYWLERFIK